MQTESRCVTFDLNTHPGSTHVMHLRVKATHAGNELHLNITQM